MLVLLQQLFLALNIVANFLEQALEILDSVVCVALVLAAGAD